MAEKLVRNSEKKEAAKPAQTAKKTATAAKKAEPAAAPQHPAAAPNKPAGRSTVGLRVAAFALWLLAIVCEVFAIMSLMGYFYPPFGLSQLAFLVIMLVLDLALAIFAAQLWKKANHINPMSEKRGKFLFYVWNELGVIMACICFIPLIVLLLKNDKLDKKTKTIATIVAVVALLITGTASADWNPISAEQKEEAQAQITANVYWTQFGHKYHLKWDADGEDSCPYIRNSDPYTGSVTEAIESGRTAICSYCASHYAEQMGLNLDLLNVEDRDAVTPQIEVNTGAGTSDTTAASETGGNKDAGF